MFTTEPKTKTSDSIELGDKTGARNNRRNVSMRSVKKTYNRKFRRVQAEQVAAELADYEAHGAY